MSHIRFYYKTQSRILFRGHLVCKAAQIQKQPYTLNPSLSSIPTKASLTPKPSTILLDAQLFQGPKKRASAAVLYFIIRTCMQACIHTYIYICINIYTQVCIGMYVRTYVCMSRTKNKQLFPYMRRYIHACMGTHANTDIQTDRQTYRQTYIRT